MQLCISLLIITLSLTSCSTKSDKKIDKSTQSNADSVRLTDTQIASLDSAFRFLIDASAKDFYDHQPPTPVGFRNVQLRNLAGTNAENHYLICGQFLALDKKDKDEWTYFATIKTSGYEQWIDGQSLGYCQDSKAIPYKGNDLSSELKNRFDSLQNVKRSTK